MSDIFNAQVNITANPDEGQIRSSAARTAAIFEQTLAKSASRTASSITASFAGTSGVFGSVSRVVDKAGRAVESLTPIFQKVTASIGPVGAGIAGITAASVGLAVVIPKLSSSIVDLAQSASTLNENMNAVRVTLGGAADQFLKTFENSEKFGLSQTQLNAAITPTAALLRNAGFAGSALADQLEILTLRAIDVGSVFNTTTEEVLNRFGSAIRGETRSVENLGIAFTALDVEAEASRLGFQRLNGEFSESQKQQARLSLILQQSDKFAGDFARTSGELANQQRILQAETQELRDEISAQFLPAAKEIVTSLRELVQDVGPKLVTILKDLQPLINAVAVGFDVLAGGVKFFVNEVSDAADAIGDAFDFLGKGFNFLTNNALSDTDKLTKGWVELTKTITKSVGNVDLKPINDALQDAVDKQKQIATLSDRVQRAQQALSTAFDRVTDAIDGVVNAQQRVVDAQQRVVDANRHVVDSNDLLTAAHARVLEATKDLSDLENRRASILNDTARDIREVTEAEEDLIEAGFRLNDINREEAEILQQINELRTPASAQELASLDRDIQRAKVALNKAIREEQDLLNNLNEEQQESLDLSGLTLDQLRNRLAVARASAAAQRATRKETKISNNTEEDQLLARISVADAQERLNELLDNRNKLENKVVNNATAIARLEESLVRLSVDRTQAIRAQSDAQLALNNLRSGETSRAREIRDIDAQILSAKRSQEQAVRGVQVATDNVANAVRAVESAERGVVNAIRDVERAERDVLTAKQNVRNIENDVLNAKRNQRFETTLLFGTEQQINDILRQRLSIVQQINGQGAVESLALSVQRSLIPTLFQGNVNLPFVTNNIGFARQVADLLLNNPTKLRELFHLLKVPGFAEGGLISQPTIARIGENFRPEVVLPLTKPDRVWSLLSRTLPKYPGAMAAAQSAILPSISSDASSNSNISTLTSAVRGGIQNSRASARRDRAEFANEIASALATKMKNMGEVHIENNFEMPTDDAEQTRKIRRVVEKTIKDAGWRIR